MHSDTVTIFNFYESSTAAIWYPHVLSGVHLETDRGQIMKLYGPDSTDNAQLHIPFVDKDGKRAVVDASGKELPWLPPKEWRKQVNDLLDDSITFNPATDFLWRVHGTETDPLMMQIIQTGGMRDFTPS